MSNDLVVISKEEYEMLAGYNLLKESKTEENVFWMRLGLIRHKTPVMTLEEAVTEKAFSKSSLLSNSKPIKDVLKEMCEKLSREWLLQHNAYLRVQNYIGTPDECRLELLLNDRVVVSDLRPQHLVGEHGYFVLVLINAIKKARDEAFEEGKTVAAQNISEFVRKIALSETKE